MWSWVLSLIFGATAVVVAVVLALAVRRGREPASRQWAWIVGVVLAVLGTVFNLFIVVGMTIAALVSAGGAVLPSWSLVFGSLALVCATVLAFVNPRWAAWVFGGTAVVVPALVALAQAGAEPETMAGEFPALGIVGFYSVRALITAAFLWLGSWPVTGSRPPASRSRAPRSENAPSG